MMHTTNKTVLPQSEIKYHGVNKNVRLLMFMSMLVQLCHAGGLCNNFSSLSSKLQLARSIPIHLFNCYIYILNILSLTFALTAFLFPYNKSDIISKILKAYVFFRF